MGQLNKLLEFFLNKKQDNVNKLDDVSGRRYIENNYLPKCWNLLFSKPRFIEIFFSSSEVRASAKIVRDESRFRKRTF